MAASKPYARLEAWIWVLIYGGLLGIVLGVATGRNDEALGWSIAVPGGLLAVVGIGLIYLRSRLGTSSESKKPR